MIDLSRRALPFGVPAAGVWRERSGVRTRGPGGKKSCGRTKAEGEAGVVLNLLWVCGVVSLYINQDILLRAINKMVGAGRVD